MPATNDDDGEMQAHYGAEQEKIWGGSTKTEARVNVAPTPRTCKHPRNFISGDAYFLPKRLTKKREGAPPIHQCEAAEHKHAIAPITLASLVWSSADPPPSGCALRETAL